SLTPMELAILRIQIYDQNGYDFESTWKKWFYKEKYGYLIKPNYNEMDLKKNDMINDRLIVSVLENMRITNTHYNHFPVYIGHILREVFQTDNSIKYFTNITDKNPIPFKKDEIPSGINKPDFGSEIPREAWNGLVSGKKTFSDLGFPKEQNTIYLVKYYHNKNIKYIISYEAFGGRVSSQDCKNFSLYDPTGILRRNIYVVGNQEMYERDYYYNSKNEISKIIEKVSQNNQLSKVGIFEKNLKYVEPTTEKVIDTPKKN
ncbi:MAG: hypothetical protein OEV44_09160, partial [Spirochaetota bacterium]|nr:hypothetical protein [Spirochaetota bacterium]